jgi:hypothetical protein
MTACAIAVHGLLDQRLDQRLDRLGAAVPDRMRAAVSARVAAALLGVTVLAMATFRYASALV